MSTGGASPATSCVAEVSCALIILNFVRLLTSAGFIEDPTAPAIVGGIGLLNIANMVFAFNAVIASALAAADAAASAAS